MSKSNYIERVKKGITFYKAMKALKKSDTLNFTINNITRYNEPLVFRITVIEMKNLTPIYVITDGEPFGRQMSIDMDKSTKSYLYCYTYDLFNQKSVAKIYFENITIKK